ncbi:SDR family NAD(P)-dependent oxidoreductase, partial [Candidatus Dojkabacteria bacterium]|nr:SDR family NAD(P)-dependent oxidoreductase [Candidatus Dojkabacteria bacterium]
RVLTTSTSGKLDYKNQNLQNYQLDLSNSESIKAFVSQVHSMPLDVLVNNAGISGGFSEKLLDPKILRKVLEVNLIGLADLTNRLIGNIKPEGRIINISSGMGAFSEDIMDGWITSYRISKAALNMYSRTLAANLKSKDIEVCSYEPGWVKTDMGGKSAPREVSQPAEEIWNLVAHGFENGVFYGPTGKREW